MEKHPMAVAEDQWFASEEGKHCTNSTSLEMPARNAVYLNNRLTKAFRAGAAAWRKHAKKLRKAGVNKPGAPPRRKKAIAAMKTR